MEMEGRRAFAASQRELWDALNDSGVLKACIPGCERFAETGARQHAVDLDLRIGAGTARFSGSVQGVDCVEPERYQVQFEGHGGVAGVGRGVARARLIPLADCAAGHPRCQLHYSVDADLDGNMAKIDPRLVDGAARALTEHFFRRLDEQLRRRCPRPAPAPAQGEPQDMEQDMEQDERAGAPTMVLDRSARAGLAARAQPALGSAGAPGWFWTGLAAVAMAAACFLFLRAG